MAVLAFWWLKKENGFEPLIVLIGQIVTILGLAIENKVRRITVQRVNKSKLGINARAGYGEDIKTTDINDSDVNVNSY